MMEIKLYIFDMGGVVARNTDVFPDVLACLDITQEEFLTCAGGNLAKLFNGQVSTAEFWARFSRRYGREVKEELFGKFFNSTIDEEIIKLIRQIKKRARVVCGTNTFDPHYDYHFSLGHYEVFDAVFASNKIGLSKPDPEFYTYILKNERVSPEHTLFIDDTEVNVLSAEQMGINATRFTDPGSLILEIKNHLKSFSHNRRSL